MVALAVATGQTREKWELSRFCMAAQQSLWRSEGNNIVLFTQKVLPYAECCHESDGSLLSLEMHFHSLELQGYSRKSMSSGR